MDDLVVVGAGGFGRVLRQFVEDLNQVENRWRFLGFVDDAAESLRRRETQLSILGTVDWLTSRPEISVVVAIGKPATRKVVVDKLKSAGVLRFPSIVHPLSYVPASVRIGQGTVIGPGVSIDPEVTLCDFVVLGRNANVGHDTVVADYVTLGPGCSIGGNVVIETGAFIGIGACAIQQVRIGKSSVVGAGSAVVRSVAANTTVLGVPARPILGRGG